jgi:Methyltransferase domain
MLEAGVRLGFVDQIVRHISPHGPRAPQNAGGVDSAPNPEQPAAMEPPVRFPVGHYYSPMYDARAVTAEPTRSRIWPTQHHEQPGIDWNGAGQREFLVDVLARQKRLEFRRDGHPDESDYYTSNGQFPALDAWILEGVLRYLQPRVTIEVGSGFSSLITARVNREYLHGSMQFTCIEPYPRGFLLTGVVGITDLIVQKVEDVPLSRFDSLGANDVLFIDSSHTVRTGGDVVWLFGQVLPRLRSGVHVHIHDVFLPGDYPEPWVREGWGWNENYLVEAFLQFNSAFQVVLGAQWALNHAREEIDTAFPDFGDHASNGGGSLWLRRL